MKWTLIFGLIYPLCFCYEDSQVKKSEASMAERLEQLIEMANSKAVLKFSGNKFLENVKATPRSYSVIVMFTAMASHRQCTICKHAHAEFMIVANSFKSSETHSNKLFFAIVDYEEDPDIFQMMNLTTVPVFIHFPPEREVERRDTMDIHRIGVSAEAIAKWINERTNIYIQIFRSPNYSEILTTSVLFAPIAAILYLRRHKLEFWYNKNVWATGALFFCFSMISGQMWNHIKDPPFVNVGQDGQINYIHRSSRGQFVLETYIVMVLNGAIALGMILLTESGNETRKPQIRRILAVAGVVLVFVFFALILSVFKFKMEGYPFSLLFN